MSHSKIILPLALCAIGLIGCTTAMPAVKPVRFADLSEQTMTQRPMVIQVDKGDQIPVKVSLRGNLLESPADTQPIMLTARRRFFVVVADDGMPRISLDGVTIGSYDKKGSLSLGIHRQDGGPAEVQVDLTQSYQSRN